MMEPEDSSLPFISHRGMTEFVSLLAIDNVRIGRLSTELSLLTHLQP